jgi:hypothetical protein
MRFVYDNVTKTYSYKGRDYDSEGIAICTCDFWDIRTNNASGLLYTGTVYRGSATYKNIGQFIYMGDKVGDGYFTNIGSDISINGSYKGYLIAKEDIERLIGTSDVSDVNFDKLAFACYKELLTK